MSVLANIVMADAEEADAIGESSRPAEDWRGVEVKGLDAAKIAMLQSILTGQTFDEALGEYDPIYAAGEDGPWVIRIPDELVERLAALEDEVLEPIGEELAATAEFEMDGWPADEVQMVLAELAALAGIAANQGKALFIWLRAAAGGR